MSSFQINKILCIIEAPGVYQSASFQNERSKKAQHFEFNATFSYANHENSSFGKAIFDPQIRQLAVLLAQGLSYNDIDTQYLN